MTVAARELTNPSDFEAVNNSLSARHNAAALSRIHLANVDHITFDRPSNFTFISMPSERSPRQQIDRRAFHAASSFAVSVADLWGSAIARSSSKYIFSGIKLAAESNYSRKLRELSKIEDGWLGEGSKAPGAEQLSKLASLLPHLTQYHPEVAVAPRWNGDLVLEWRRDQVEYTAEIGASDNLFLCVDHTDTDDLEETEMDYSREALLRFLQKGTWD